MERLDDIIIAKGLCNYDFMMHITNKENYQYLCWGLLVSHLVNYRYRVRKERNTGKIR